MEFSKSFQKANWRSLKIAEDIEDFLKFKGLQSLIPFVNACSLNLRLPEAYGKRNSTICVDQRGLGKSTLLNGILAKSNPKFVQVLDKKIYESQLVRKPKSYFHGKILIHDDLTSAIGGKTTKQREQIESFFTQLLSDGNYSRDGLNELKDVRCVGQFGVAWESFKKNRKALHDNTFLDRFAPYKIELTYMEKQEILEHRDLLKENNTKLPRVVLPLRKSLTSIKRCLSPEMKKEINTLAMELATLHIMSFARAQDHIEVFMMSNAFLNGRNKTNVHDLELYKIVHEFHKKSSLEDSRENTIRNIILMKPSATPKDIVKMTGFPQSSVYVILKRINS